MKKLYMGLVLAIVVLLTGCAATSPILSSAHDQEAKKFKPSKSLANIYIYRNEFLGGALSKNLHINGKLIGTTGPETYFLLRVKPGKYEIYSDDNKEDNVTLKVKAKKNYFVWQEMKVGLLFHGTKLSVVEGSLGRKGVLECERIKTNF